MSERYCRSCGEDAWDFYDCELCHQEFCSDCGDNECVRHSTCPKCMDKLAEDDDRERRCPTPKNMLPCMREWLERKTP